MGLTSFEFGIFILFGVVLYYTVFRGQQWKLLLVLSYLYYAAADVKNVIFLLAVTIITYTAGCILDRDMEKKKRKRIVAAALFLDFLILGVLKYTDFLIDNINRIFHGNISMLELVLPLGLSFFTFQSQVICWMYTGKRQRRRKISSGMHYSWHGFRRLCRDQSEDLSGWHISLKGRTDFRWKISNADCS